MASDDLVWQVIKNNSSFLVRRSTHGGSQFSREPLNLRNKHTYTHSGLANSKAVGVQRSKSDSLVLLTKNAKQKTSRVEFRPHASSRKMYRSIFKATANKGYRGDLNKAALARASALVASKREPAPLKPKKARGRKSKA